MQRIKHIFRSISKYKTASIFTILSLVTAFLCIIIISLYVSFERSYDNFHTNGESIYRVEIDNSANIPAVLADVVREKLPEIVNISATCYRGKRKISIDNTGVGNDFIIASPFYVEGEFLSMFTFPLINGNAATALVEAGNIVLSESLSKKIFGNENAYGKILFLNKRQFRVSGVMKDVPANSTFKPDCLVSFETLTKDNGGEKSYTKLWNEWSFHVYIQTCKGTIPQTIIEKISEIDVVSEKLDNVKERASDKEPLILRPLDDFHYASSYWGKANKLILNILSVLSFLILTMGFVNFINFSTSQASQRAKALTVQQILGDRKIGARFQILIESVVLSLISILLAIVIHLLIYPTIESLFEIQGLAFKSQPIVLVWYILLAIAFGVSASIYPSRYITSAPMSEVVKGKVFFTGKGKIFRNTLVIVQFVFTIGLIISAITIEKQIHFWKNYDIGIDKEHVVYLRTSNDLRKHHQAFADEIMKSEMIKDYTYTQFIPGKVGMGWGRKIDDQYIQLKCWPVDNHFLDFFDLNIIKGRAFNPKSMADKDSYILNKKAVETFGWDNPLERKMGGFNGLGDIVGVAENFNFSRLQDEIEPMQFWLTDTRKYILILRLSPGNYSETIKHIKSVAEKFDSVNKVEIKFLDDELNKLYAKEEKVAHFIEFLAAWCVLLALFGLLGLSVFICQDRTKEIGVRKVNGAKTIEVMAMLNKDFIKWVLISFIIASPIAYYAMSRWLENFAYKTELSWWIFALAGLITMGIALLTVSFQSYRSATMNPVESLRNE